MISILFAVTTFWAAALLFIVEPHFARMLLPRLGGAPAVWNTAMVFYQAGMLAGYGAAHVMTRRLTARRQVVAQVGLMLAALALLPLAVPAGWTPPVERNPVPWLLAVMAATVGLPFFVLATLSPLLQRWFAVCGEENPYWLYAASNAGSLVGLLAYPVVIEPWLGLRAQAVAWMGGFVVLVVLVAMCGWAARRGGGGDVGTGVATTTGETISWGRRLRWVVLAFAPSSLMLSVTTYLSTEVAAVPLLWVVPLAVYLVTFILVFARREWVKMRWMAAVLPWVVLPLTVAYGMRWNQYVVLVGAWNLAALFVGAMVCHGQLAAEKPGAERLTEFYWWVSVGGVLGGVFNGLLAPVMFAWVAEYPISIVVVCLLAPVAMGENRLRWGDVAWPVGIGVGGWALGEWLRNVPTETAGYSVLLKLAAPAAVAILLRQRPVRFGLAMAALFAAGTWLPGERERMLEETRSFFGVHRVWVDAGTGFHQLSHGTTVHGIQNPSAQWRREPLGYYSPVGPLGQAMGAWRQMGWPLPKVGAVGLGTGAVAAYARPGEEWTFFEIDPTVERIAREAECFTYLADCRGRARVVVGDARLSLEKSEETFDVMILDAYSSDAIPLHLLTREALQLYLKRLKCNGWLLFHYSNRHLDLAPVLAGLARDAGLACRVQEQSWASSENRARGVFTSSWAVMSREETYLGRLLWDQRWERPREPDRMRVWTDDYASLMSVWRRGETDSSRH